MPKHICVGTCQTKDKRLVHCSSSSLRLFGALEASWLLYFMLSISRGAVLRTSVKTLKSCCISRHLPHRRAMSAEKDGNRVATAVDDVIEEVWARLGLELHCLLAPNHQPPN
jgi:hypothetical protein